MVGASRFEATLRVLNWPAFPPLGGATDSVGLLELTLPISAGTGQPDLRRWSPVVRRRRPNGNAAPSSRPLVSESMLGRPDWAPTASAQREQRWLSASIDRSVERTFVMGGTAFVLGAGFSRAASTAMPLTDELGIECARRVPYPQVPTSFADGRFETWLSELAENQPYLNEQSNLDNQALFTRFSEAIAMVLQQRTFEALAGGWPAWMPTFIKAAHHARATIATFNYDTLIECAAATGLLYEVGMYDAVSWTELTGDVPSWPPGSMMLAAEPADTLRLLKLHGSLNWYWSPGDSTGATVARRALPGTYGSPHHYTEDDRQRRLPGRVPLIVPPAATKSSYYQNPITREMWQQAAVRLSRADRIVIMGYSLPLTDLTFSSMFRRAVVEGDMDVVVVDPGAAVVADRIASLGIDRSRISTIDGGSAINDFVVAWAHELSAEALNGLGSFGNDSAPMAVVWGRSQCAHVRSVEIQADTVVLKLGALGDWERLGRDSSAVGELLSDLPLLGDALSPGLPLRVELDTDFQEVLAWASAESRTGYPAWNVLYPAGLGPS